MVRVYISLGCAPHCQCTGQPLTIVSLRDIWIELEPHLSPYSSFLSGYASGFWACTCRGANPQNWVKLAYLTLYRLLHVVFKLKFAVLPKTDVFSPLQQNWTGVWIYWKRNLQSKYRQVRDDMQKYTKNIIHIYLSNEVNLEHCSLFYMNNLHFIYKIWDFSTLWIYNRKYVIELCWIF